MLLLIDNYDSFTWNLVHFLGDLGAEVEVRRNDALTPAEALAMRPAAVILSPGPCTPNEAGICLDLIAACAESRTPLLGVCLGHQAIGQAFGARVTRAPEPVHGKVWDVRHGGEILFSGLPSPFRATRYHSLVVARDSLPNTLTVTAETEDGLVMGLSHHALPIHGVQFHPESIASEHGHRILGNFLDSVNNRPNPAGMIGLKPVLARLADGESLAESEAEAAFAVIMAGEATPAQIAGLLMAMRVRGETVAEMTGAVRAMRARMIAVDVPEGAIDIVGTGGDASGSLNISTAAALVVAGCGVPVAKHGNRALSSKSGAADALAALGVNLDLPLERLPAVIAEAGILFLMAPRHHSALRHAGGARVELGTRTIFNLLGPLANPGRVKRQMTGAFHPRWLRPMAETLARLGTERAWLVHGQGLDELALSGPSEVVELRDGAFREFTVTPEEAGIAPAPPEAIRGGDPAENAAALHALLDGAPGAYREVVRLNAAAALVVAGRAATLREGAALAASSIDSGAAMLALTRLRHATSRDD